jgi:hypothetical protein
VIHAAIGWLKATDPNLGQPSKEDLIEEAQQQEQAQVLANFDFVPRISVSPYDYEEERS